MNRFLWSISLMKTDGFGQNVFFKIKIQNSRNWFIFLFIITTESRWMTIFNTLLSCRTNWEPFMFLSILLKRSYNYYFLLHSNNEDTPCCVFHFLRCFFTVSFTFPFKILFTLTKKNPFEVFLSLYHLTQDLKIIEEKVLPLL